MRKYLYIYKSELMSQLQYLFNLVFGFIGCGIILFIFFNLWHYIYSDSSQIINGYSVDQMIWYVIITEIIIALVSPRVFLLLIFKTPSCCKFYINILPLLYYNFNI